MIGLQTVRASRKWLSGMTCLAPFFWREVWIEAPRGCKQSFHYYVGENRQVVGILLMSVKSLISFMLFAALRSTHVYRRHTRFNKDELTLF